MVVAQKKIRVQAVDDRIRRRIVKAFHKSQKRLLLLDYDGTLAPYTINPLQAQPSPELSSLLKTLTSDRRNRLVVVSGRDQQTLEQWLGCYEIDCIAEHGLWAKVQGGKWKKLHNTTTAWKPSILLILKRFSSQLVGSFVEEKRHSLAWHYRASEPLLGSLRAQELIDELRPLVGAEHLRILHGSKVVEIADARINKGIAVQQVLAHYAPDCILAVGDDRTDEDMFTVLPETAYTIKVGMSPSTARFNVYDLNAVMGLLKELSSKD